MQTETMRRLLDVLKGEAPCDLVLEHADVVDVYGGGIQKDRTVLVAEGLVAGVFPAGTEPVYRGEKDVPRLNCAGKVLTPGLMDAHVHIESTMLIPSRFARAVLPCGTTEVVADPHEIANVCGVAGIRWMLAESEGLPVRIHLALPSCVPCTPFEDAGAVLDAKALAPFWKNDRVRTLGEVMNYPGLLAGDADLLRKIADAKAAGRSVDGHCPGLAGADLQAYAALGVGNDHEETDPARIAEHVSAGMYVFVRDGSAARSLAAVLPAVNGRNASRFCFCTDDLHAEDILAEGHVNAILARAVALGLDPVTAVRMATINTARCFGLRNTGAVAAGHVANLVLFEDLVGFKPTHVVVGGRLVCENGRLLEDVPVRGAGAEVLGTVRMKPLAGDAFELAVPSGRARVIGLNPGSIVTTALELEVAVDDEGNFAADRNPGLCKIAVVERHREKGLVGLGILKGYAREGCLLGGAIATSIAHDSHNIVVAGSNDADMRMAVQMVAEVGGGIVVVRDGKYENIMPLPVAGLMSQDPAEKVAEELAAIHRSALGLAVSEDTDPVMTLSFMALCVIPELRVNTRGLFDVRSFGFVSVDARAESADDGPAAGEVNVGREKRRREAGQDRRSALSEAREQGRAEKAGDMARVMLAAGEPVEKIVKYTGLTVAEVEGLRGNGQEKGRA